MGLKKTKLQIKNRLSGGFLLAFYKFSIRQLAEQKTYIENNNPANGGVITLRFLALNKNC